jgi:hypothetical protein
MSAEWGLLDHHVAATLQMTNQPVGDHPGHECVGVVDPFSPAEFERESKAFRQVCGIGGAKIVVIRHRKTIVGLVDQKKNININIRNPAPARTYFHKPKPSTILDG